MTIRDRDLRASAMQARQLWLDSLPKEIPVHVFSPDFENQMQEHTEGLTCAVE